MPKLNLIGEISHSKNLGESKPNNFPLVIHQWNSIKENEMTPNNNIMIAYDNFLSEDILQQASIKPNYMEALCGNISSSVED